MPHIHEKIDFTVEVFVVYKNKVLLRLHDKYNLWLSVGGHIELDEDPNQAAVREVFEEVALKVKLYDGLKPEIEKMDNYQELIPPFFLNRHRINEKHEHVTMTYFATSETDIIVQEEDEKSIGICIPGIAYSKTGNVWAPNITGWENYPLKDEFRKRFPHSRITIESDRTCYILGEASQGAAK